MTSKYAFTVRRPISSDRNLDGEGMVVSKHRTLMGAYRSLIRQTMGAKAQGGYSQDYIYNEQTEEREALTLELA